MNKQSGGPAYPFAVMSAQGGGVITNDEIYMVGASMRDWFAAHASEEDVKQFLHAQDAHGLSYQRSRAEARYMHADAMLALRSKAWSKA